MFKKVKAFESKLKSYIVQISVVGFNSQKYDIPLIRPYLPSSIAEHDCTPNLMSKKMGGYMVISSKRLIFLDILNYLVASTSLRALYNSYRVSTPKGSFPYAWFDTLDKLEATELPPIEEFHSILMDSSIKPDEYEACQQVWIREGMTKFAKYVEYYNNADVIGLTEASNKMVTHKQETNELDISKTRSVYRV